MLTGVAPPKLIDGVHETYNEAEASNQAQILITYDKTHAFNETSNDNLPSGFLISSWNVHNYDSTTLLLLSISVITH